MCILRYHRMLGLCDFQDNVKQSLIKSKIPFRKWNVMKLNNDAIESEN